MSVNVLGGALEFDAVINNSQFKQQIDEMNARLSSLVTNAKKEANAIDNLGSKVAIAVGGYLSFSAASNFISQMVKVRGEFQQLEVAFNTMLKSKEKADQLMQEAVQLAAKTPFTLSDVGTAAKQLLAYGTASDKVVGTIKMLGDVAAGVGAPLNDIVYLYGTLQTQGRAYTKDIMQFTGRGIPIVEELAKQFGVTKTEVQGLVEAGKVGFPEVEKAFQSLTGSGGLFFNLMEAQSKTLTGQLSNLEDAISRMFNDIGKSQQGVVGDIIGGLTSLVNNYQDVIDVVKVLTLTYGAYKAAIVSTAAYEAVTKAVKGLTLAEYLHYQALELSRKAQLLLNTTMLSNPYVAAAVAITAVVSSLIIFGKTVDNVKSKADLLATAQEKISDKTSEAQAKLLPYIEQLKKTNITEGERLEIYKKINAIDPQILKGIDAKALSYQNLAAGVNKYIDSLRQQIALETNEDAIKASIQQEQLLEKRIETAKKAAEFSAQNRDKNAQGFDLAPGLSAVSKDVAADNLKNLQNSLDEQKKITQSFVNDSNNISKQMQEAEAKKAAALGRTIEVIDAEISKLKEEQTHVSNSSKQWQAFEDQLKKLQNERDAITGKSKSAIAAENKLQSEANRLLEQRANLIERINQMQQNTEIFTKQQSELDRINDKYKALFSDIEDFNEQVNKKDQIGIADIIKLNYAKMLESQNATYKQDAENYKDLLNSKEQAYEDFQSAVSEIGVDSAREIYKKDIGEFTTYLEFLQAELNKFSDENDPGKLIRANLATQITEAQKQQQQSQAENYISTLSEMIKATKTFAQKRADINTHYDDLEATARKGKDAEIVAQRIAILENLRNEDQKNLQESISSQTELYKQLNTDILDLTRQQIEERKQLIQKTLKDGFVIDNLTGEQIPLTTEQVKILNHALAETDKVLKDQIAEHFDDISKTAQQVSFALGDLGEAIKPFNEGLADTLATMSSLANVAANASGAIASFVSGDIVGGIASTVQTITGVFRMFAAAKESEKKAAEDQQAFQLQVLKGEIDINLQYRERIRSQVELNKLRIQGILDEQALLEEQRKSNLDDYNQILALIQKEQYIAGQHTEKQGGFLGIGAKTVTVDDFASLAGMNYDQLEQLFMSGQLTDKAKELFTELQQLKQEGADIEQTLADAKAQMDETFTGTTSDSILDSIVQGFADGKKATEDFAGDFEDLMRNAILNSLKYQALEKPLQEFYANFAQLTESDNQLTAEEINALREQYNAIVTDAAKQFEDLQNLTNINFNDPTGDGNSLSGAIKGMTAEQADLLAGQFSGLRLTAFDQLNVARQQLDALNAIVDNTAWILNVHGVLKDFQTNGIKVK